MFGVEIAYSDAAYVHYIADWHPPLLRPRRAEVPCRSCNALIRVVVAICGGREYMRVVTTHESRNRAGRDESAAANTAGR